MIVTVNQQEVDTQATSLQELAQALGLPAQGVAIAIDNRMIPRAEWERTPLREGASIIIIKAACGG